MKCQEQDSFADLFCSSFINFSSFRVMKNSPPAVPSLSLILVALKLSKNCEKWDKSKILLLFRFFFTVNIYFSLTSLRSQPKIIFLREKRRENIWVWEGLERKPMFKYFFVFFVLFNIALRQLRSIFVVNQEKFQIFFYLFSFYTLFTLIRPSSSVLIICKTSVPYCFNILNNFSSLRITSVSTSVVSPLSSSSSRCAPSFQTDWIIIRLLHTSLFTLSITK